MRERGALKRCGVILAVALGALLLVSASGATPPSNDGFSSAEVLLPSSGSRNGTNVDATEEAGEPDHTGNVGGASVWYRWTAPASGTVSFNTFGSGFDTLLAVYTGSDVTALNLVAQNDDGLGWKWTSKLAFSATAGTTYSIAVDGYNDGTNGPARGTFVLNWDLTPSTSSAPPNDAFASAQPIDGPGGSTAGSTFGATKETGEPNHGGNEGGKSVWFRWTAPYDGTFTFTTDQSQFNTLLGVYQGIDVGSLARVVGSDDIAWNNYRSSVTFDATGGTTYSIAIDGKKFSYSGAASGDYVLDWRSNSASPTGPANDWFANAASIVGGSGAVSGTNIGATKETGEPAHAGNPGGASVWYSWTAPSNGTVEFSTAGSSFDTLLAAYTGGKVGSLTEVASNDDAGQSDHTSDITFTAFSGTTYRIAVDGRLLTTSPSAAAGDVVLGWSLSAASAPANDNFDSATTLTGIGGIFSRSTLGATRQPGEPDHAGNAGGASVWYRWTAPGDGQWRFYTEGSLINTLMAVYTGDSVDSLTLVGSSDDVSAGDRSSSVTIVARKGTTYSIAVDGYRGPTGPAASGAFTFQWELVGADPATVPNDDFASAWQLTGQSGTVTASNTQSTKEAGEPNHAGNPGGHSVWFKWTAPATGYVSWDTPGSSFDTLLAVYQGPDMADLTQVAADDDIAYNLWWPDGRYRESYLSFIAQQGQTYYVAVDGKAFAGGPGVTGSIFLEWWQNPPSAAATLLAAGDVHADCGGTFDDQTAQIVQAFPTATVAADGDLADPGSTASAFANCYDPTWGLFKARTRPAVGNHEYDLSPNAAPYFSYFGTTAAGAVGKGFYSYELGGWHVVVLNSNCTEVGGCGPGSEQYAWLQQDLAANPNSCTLAYFHHPLFASSDLATPTVKPFWDLLYQYGADVIVNAHARQYERFAPMTPDGVLDPTQGIREFVVGTGGGVPLSLGPTAPNSEVANNAVYGVLSLSLSPGAYAWQFLPTAGSSFSDSGHGICNGGSAADPVLAAAPTAPTANTATSPSGRYNVSWKASPDLPTGAQYSLWQRSVKATTWTQVASGLTGTSYNFDAKRSRAEGTWVYRVQATGGGKTSAFSPVSNPVVVDKSSPLPPIARTDRPAEDPVGGWWRDQVTVSFADNGDAVLADGSPGVGVDPSSINAPVIFKSNGTFTASDQAVDYLGWKSLLGSITVKVDHRAPTLDLHCGDVKLGATFSATFSAKDAESGLASPPIGSVVEDSSVKGKNTLTVTAQDKVGHTTIKTCAYNVK
jgi:Calcineurin-like phosphoesterase